MESDLVRKLREENERLRNRIMELEDELSSHKVKKKDKHKPKKRWIDEDEY